MNYRSDIDGLRAMAVLSVIMFHLNNDWLTGGFIGVDIFFVISGYLITKNIYSEMINNQFSFKNFYQRRINRILPAFFFVIFVTSFFAWYVLAPDEFNIFLNSVKSTTYFSENIFFANKTGGYFDLSADNMPILHTWSLAVEEQFYILLPFILLFLLRIKFHKKDILIVLFVLSLISFSLAQISPNSYFLSRHNYYSLYTGRAGELLAGSIIGILTTSKNVYQMSRLNKIRMISFYKNIFSMSGLFIVSCSIIFISNKYVFPSFLTIIPVLGVVLILYFSDKNTFLYKFLSLRLFVFIGLISYSLYLWHWPIISLYKQYFIIDHLTGFIDYFFVISSILILSLLTYYFIENPCRKCKKSFKFSFCCYYLLPTIIIFSFYYLQKNTKFADNIFIERFNFTYGHSLRWIQGKDDFIFLGDKYEKTIRKLTLSIKPTEKEIISLTKNFKEITTEASRHGTKVVLLIAPDKARIYSNYLPDELHVSKIRYIDFYLSELTKNKELIIYDPEDDLLEITNNIDEKLYYRTDSHWNLKGAYIAYTGLLKKLGMNPVQVSFESVNSLHGGLIDIAELKDENIHFHNDDTFKIQFIQQTSIQCISKGLTNEAFGNNEDCINSLAPIDKKVWVIGDSFSAALRDYLTASFKKVNFVGHWNEQLPILSKELSEAKEKPDIVIIIKVARSF